MVNSPFRSLFRIRIRAVIAIFLGGLESTLIWLPPEVIAIVIAIIAWRTAGKGLAIFSIVGFLYIGSVDIWEAAMQTLAVVLTATVFCIVIGVCRGLVREK